MQACPIATLASSYYRKTQQILDTKFWHPAAKASKGNPPLLPSLMLRQKYRKENQRGFCPPPPFSSKKIIVVVL